MCDHLECLSTISLSRKVKSKLIALIGCIVGMNERQSYKLLTKDNVLSLLKSIQRMIDNWQSKQVLVFVTSFLDENHPCTKKFLTNDDFSQIEDLCLKILVDLTVHEKIT